MSSFERTSSNLEELPDEILLLICRYLSSTDVLFSFYGLNSRLSQTISGYYRDVVLAEIPYERFKNICKSILPEIGVHIRSLVVSNEWKGVLSKIFLSYFGETISLVFPHLKRLILNTFRVGLLILFLDSLQNLAELTELKIVGLYEIRSGSIEPKTLLHRIFTANNNRLTSISFDDNSSFFPYKTENDIYYPNIEKLVIELRTLNDFHQLLTVLPRLHSIDAAIHNNYFEADKESQYVPLFSLRHCRLRLFGRSWNLDILMSVVKRISNVEELSIAIESFNDIRLIDGQQMFSYLSLLPLKNFNYFLRFYASSVIDHTKIVSTWQQFNQEFVCTKIDEENSLVLYTLPFVFPYLILQCSLAKNNIFSDSYAPQVGYLTLYDVSTRIAETFSIIKKCHRIHCLYLGINEKVEPKSFQQVQLCKLPYLTFFVALNESSVNTEDFQKLLEISPNLYHLAVSYEFLQVLLDNESVCHLLRRRITHLLIHILVPTNFELVVSSISRLASVFPSLKHFYFGIKKNYRSAELLILAMFTHLSKWSSIVSFGVADITIDSKILTKGVRQWVLENSSLSDNDSFVTDYSDDRFRLWL